MGQTAEDQERQKAVAYARKKLERATEFSKKAGKAKLALGELKQALTFAVRYALSRLTGVRLFSGRGLLKPLWRGGDERFLSTKSGNTKFLIQDLQHKLSLMDSHQSPRHVGLQTVSPIEQSNSHLLPDYGLLRRCWEN